MGKLRKVIRFITIYGFKWAFVKIAGRTRNTKLRILYPALFFGKRDRFISLIGCGQFGFSTINYLLYKKGYSNYLDCYDIDAENAQSTAKFWGYKSTTVDALYENKQCRLIYVASNHYTHTDYASRALERNIDVFVEKPISVTRGQLTQLLTAKRDSEASLYVGYNRPFSKAIRTVDSLIKDSRQPISLSCFISGHLLEPDHWYRIPQEGTRVCGNMGHWIDLSVHLMNQRGEIPARFDLTVSYANEQESDDNVVVNIATELNDIISICLTARSEPYEGINETINLQNGDLIAKIDDFRTMKVWKGNMKKKYIYFPKDAGHKRAVTQPVTRKGREFEEILVSTLLMLHIKDMVVERKRHSTLALKYDSIYNEFSTAKSAFEEQK